MHQKKKGHLKMRESFIRQIPRLLSSVFFLFITQSIASSSHFLKASCIKKRRISHSESP
jgi:hypothetical protein